MTGDDQDGEHLDDRTLALRAQSGDGAAFDVLVRRHQVAALRLATVITGSSQAEDAAQEGFVRAYRALSRFDPDRSFRTWLLHIVANSAKNQVRSGERHQRLAQRATTLRVAGREPEAGPGESALAREQREQVLVALQSLSPDDRLILALRWFEDLCEAEMADALDVRPGTVKSRLHRAMGRLRTALRSEVDDD